MIALRALLVPLAGLSLALAVPLGGRAGTVLAVIAAAMFGVATIFALTG